MGLNNRFSGDDPYILTQQIQTANNNQGTLQATLAETDFLRGSSVTSDAQAINATLGTPFPAAQQAAQSTVGAALGDVGQDGTYSQEPDGGGIPCFAAGTEILQVMGNVKPIENIVTGVDHVFCFDPKTGVTTAELVIGKHEHWVEETYHVTFENGTTTITTKNHKYWTRDKTFVPIGKLDEAIHWAFEWQKMPIIKTQRVKGGMVVYNLTVRKYHNYVADGMAVSNLKSLDNPFGG